MSAQRSGRDRGESLLEILMTVAIMGICFAALLAGLGVSVLTSGLHREQAYDGSYLRVLAERVEAQPFDSCSVAPTGTDYSASVDGVVPPGAGFAPEIVSVEHWDGSGFSDTDFTGACPASDSLQRVEIRVLSPDPRAEDLQTFLVLKRMP